MMEIYVVGDASNKEGVRSYSRNPYRNHFFFLKNHVSYSSFSETYTEATAGFFNPESISKLLA